MFYFLNFDTATQSSAYDKGILFEKLCRKLVSALGYEVSEFREKVAGAEYDITASSRLNGAILIGEAKALQRSIEIGIVKAFVGSLDVYDPGTMGIFLSVSEFTPDSREYLRRLQERKQKQVLTIVGSDILTNLSKHLSYLSQEQISLRAVNEFHMLAGDTDFIVSDRGDFFVQLLVKSDETRPSAFCVFRHDGQLVNEPEFAKQLRQHLPHLRELSCLPVDRRGVTNVHLPELPLGPPEGVGWFDYFLPAPPSNFIGRTEELRGSQKFVTQVRQGKSKIRVFQILSRSGVGKSSFLIRTKEEFSKIGPSIIEDARNIKSHIDVMGIIRGFVLNAYKFFGYQESVPTETQALIELIQNIDKSLYENDQIGR